MPLSRPWRRVLLWGGLTLLVAAFGLEFRSPYPIALPRHKSAERSGLRILSWNIGQIYFGSHRDSRAADRDLLAVAQVIRTAEPDLVALQELRDRKQLEDLLGLLGGTYRGYVPADEINDRRAAVLIHGGEEGGFSELVTSTGRSAAIARIPWEGQEVVFISVHLDAFSPELRSTQVEELLDFVLRTGETALIVAGDFNFDADFLAMHEPRTSDAILYRLMTSHFEDAALSGASTTIVDRRLDYVFSRGRLKHRSVRVLDQQNPRFMDHRPLLVDYGQ